MVFNYCSTGLKLHRIALRVVTKIESDNNGIFSKLSLLFLVGVFLGCPTQPVEPVPPDVSGMAYISAANQSFVMGSNTSWSASDEKPPMRVTFTYNFRIDTSEVTVAHYWQTMGYLPQPYTINDTALTIPICNVSWFDAVLFCNRRSIEEGRDTVYSYYATSSTANGRTYRMDGFRTDLSVDGYRLPTEAEWEYVACEGTSGTIFPWGNEPDTATASTIAWFENNAADRTHPVAQLRKNRFGIYDLFGNAAEWVNDWKGYFVDDTLTDYIGPLGNDLEERPVKGGSYQHAISHLRPSCRSDVYSTQSSTATEYLGFRCCLGAVSAPSRINTGATVDTTNPVKLTSKSDFQWLPNRNTKIAFVNQTQRLRYLCYSDFLETNPRIYQFTDISPVYAPTISPDGNWVAFCTRDEGYDDGSIVYIRRLDKTGSQRLALKDTPAFIPRWWVDPQTADTFIVYTTSAIINTLAEWSSGQTKMQKIAGGVPVGTPVVLEPSGSFHDGLSADRRYLATGYTRLYMKDIVSGRQKTLFTSPQNGKPEGDTSQVCNVSISPDTTGGTRVLFLDFGSGSTPSSLLGTTYGIHEVLFVSDFSGSTRAWHRCPPDLAKWENPEWSNHPDYAVAIGNSVSSPEKGGAVYGINLKNSSHHKCIEGIDLKQPYLWISDNPIVLPEITFDPDSACWYNEPSRHMFQKNFASKFPWFLERVDSIELLGLGSSRLQNGYVPLSNNDLFGYNLAYAAGGLLGIKNILHNYALHLCPKLKVVVISLDICWWDLDDGDYCWTTSIANTKGYLYDQHHSFWPTGLPERFAEHAKSISDDDYGAGYIYININRGWYPIESNGWGPNPPAFESRWNWAMNQNCADNLKTLETIARELESRSIHLIGVLFPQSPNYKDTPVYGYEGPSKAAANEIITRLQSMDQLNDNFHFYDANLNGAHDYTNNEFFDECHLSEAGSYKFSSRFNTVLDSILKQE